MGLLISRMATNTGKHEGEGEDAVGKEFAPLDQLGTGTWECDVRKRQIAEEKALMLEVLAEERDAVLRQKDAGEQETQARKDRYRARFRCRRKWLSEQYDRELEQLLTHEQKFLDGKLMFARTLGYCSDHYCNQYDSYIACKDYAFYRTYAPTGEFNRSDGKTHPWVYVGHPEWFRVMRPGTTEQEEAKGQWDDITISADEWLRGIIREEVGKEVGKILAERTVTPNTI